MGENTGEQRSKKEYAQERSGKEVYMESGYVEGREDQRD
jgi:hypothetical protein